MSTVTTLMLAPQYSIFRRLRRLGRSQSSEGGPAMPRATLCHVVVEDHVGLFQSVSSLDMFASDLYDPIWTMIINVDCCGDFDHVTTMALRGSIHRDYISSEGPWMSMAIRSYREWRTLFVWQSALLPLNNELRCQGRASPWVEADEAGI